MSVPPAMIAFASLFLGIVFGSETVILQVTGPVAAVELRLDGKAVGRRTAPPWEFPIDVGEEIMPHELVAVALDASGAEIDRARQWLNLPSPPAEASAVLEPARGDAPAIAHLRWESLAAAAPQRVEVTFDGRPVPVDDPRRIELPSYDPRQLHFFRAELIFTEHISSVIEVTVGGTYGDQVQTELTAVPIDVRKNRRALRQDPASLSTWFHKHGQPVTVVAADRGPPVVILVADVESPVEMHRMSLTLGGGVGSYATRLRRNPRFGRLGTGQLLRLLWPVTRRQQGTSSLFELFLTSNDVPGDQMGIPHLLHFANAPKAYRLENQRLADAVVVAGTEAAGRRRPRAVLLLLSGAPVDHSRLAAEQARRYLERLHVPLFVWSAAPQPEPSAHAWGEIIDVHTASRFRKAVRDLTAALDRQWIVWVDGIHRPQDIALSELAEGWEIAR